MRGVSGWCIGYIGCGTRVLMGGAVGGMVEARWLSRADGAEFWCGVYCVVVDGVVVM